jgi:hypothetical protein
MFFFLFYKFFLQEKWENKRVEQVLSGGWGEVAEIIYTHVNKCKNNKNKI